MTKTARQIIDETITHKAFQQQIEQYARLNGWLVYFTWRPIHSPAGYPDLTMVRGARLIFAELKVKKDKPSPAQVEWLEALRATGKCEIYLWRPGSWEDIEVKLIREVR